MNELSCKFWRLVYWLSWPARFVMLNNSARTRVVIERDGKILVLKELIGDGKWGLPGGGQKRAESAEDCALREVFEETGLKLDKIKKLDDITGYSHGIKTKLAIFISKVDKAQIKLRKSEIIDFAWLSTSELSESNSSRNTLEVIEIWKQKG